jgi:beta-glucuronidase
MRAILFTLILFFICNGRLSAQNLIAANPDNIGLFPQQNDFRNTLNLSGIWKFKKDSLDVGEKEKWFNGLNNYRSIAVPGSWNEQFDDLRDYLNQAWYETDTFIPSGWKGQRIFIRVGSASYAAKIWINGVQIGYHEGGNLPFVFEISSSVRWGTNNRISIQVENILKPTRVPTGEVKGGPFQNFPRSNYDFFPFAGLQRNVYLYAVPTAASIKDITIKTGFTDTTGQVEVNIKTEGKATKARIIISGNGRKQEFSANILNQVATASVLIPNVRLWSPDDPFMYTVEVVIGNGKTIFDRYTLETGVRTIVANNNQLLLNGKPIFLKGFGKHEDFPVFGRGTANPVIVKDFELMKWAGANSFRTSHYPYDEEFMQMADRQGFLVIDEIPAVGLYFHGDSSELAQRQAMCKQYINELITRDKNHPSVIMWCVANEPFPRNISTTGTSADREATSVSTAALKELITLVKEKDKSRLAVLVGVMGGPSEWLGLSDVICINRYYGWYTHTGDLAGATKLLGMELDGLHKKFNKPIIITEFGADAYPGMHAEQSEMFTEEFQVDFLKAYLDVAEKRNFVAGMHVWCFADFKTGQGIIRFGGMNYKGVFTRDRKPKMAAHYLHSRWANKSSEK